MVSPTPAQLEAITHAGGPLLVIGGAGTGKTTVLCERFSWLIREGGLAPEAILVLTVSEAGAAALRERLETGLDGGFEELTVTTVHDFCARLLHDEALEAGLDPFSAPVTPADRIAMLLERIDELPLASHDIRGNPSALLGSIVGRIDRLKDELVSHEDYAAWAGTLGPEADREREFAAIYAAHDRMLEQAGSLDFGDLLLNAFRVLRTQPHVRARVTARYRHMLVDELQDANFAQGLLMKLLAGEHGQVSAAGDDDQAIHRLRGAAAKNLRDFEAEWPAATVVHLEDSHRCPERVLVAARAVAEPVPERIVKELRGRAGGDVAFWRCESERAQAQAVAAEIERLIAREEVAPEDVCVLVRSIRNEGQAVAVALEERAVPHRLAGAAAFFQRAEVRDLLA
ncbi:MAG: ATP-dependent helicase UvrD/PcrA, partial [Solirubrobacteraceae bacterium]|nr:ATP-dependent helicase UvrD/PcrA [Solirubrobacteraceae bacterium]